MRKSSLKKFNWIALIFVILGVVVLSLQPFMICEFVWYNPLTWLVYLPCTLLATLIGITTKIIGAILIIFGIMRFKR